MTSCDVCNGYLIGQSVKDFAGATFPMQFGSYSCLGRCSAESRHAFEGSNVANTHVVCFGSQFKSSLCNQVMIMGKRFLDVSSQAVSGL